MSKFPQRPTLSDVAEAAGVSTVTVSRVIEGSAKVAEKTRVRVQDAMERIGYYGNAAASQLVSGRARTIGIVASNTADYGYAEAIRGIEKGARALDLAVLIVVIEGTDSDSVRKAVSTVASHALAGVIVIDFDSAAHAVLPAIPEYIPVVSATSPSEGSGVDRPYVSLDEYDGGRLAAQHLIDLGHRSIFVIAPPIEQPVERRSLGVSDALDEARLPHYPSSVASQWGPAAGYDCTTRLIDDYGDRVTAIACANDEVALGALRALMDRGLRVPEDVSVIGFDDQPLAAYTAPALTTVHQDFLQLGEVAFATLRAVIEARDLPEERHIRPSLVIRETTSAPHPERGL